MIAHHDLLAPQQSRRPQVAGWTDHQSLQFVAIDVLELNVHEFPTPRHEQPGFALEQLVQVFRAQRLLPGIPSLDYLNTVGKVTLRALAGCSTLPHVSQIDLHRPIEHRSPIDSDN